MSKTLELPGASLEIKNIGGALPVQIKVLSINDKKEIYLGYHQFKELNKAIEDEFAKIESGFDVTDDEYKNDK